MGEKENGKGEKNYLVFHCVYSSLFKNYIDAFTEYKILSYTFNMTLS